MKMDMVDLRPMHAGFNTGQFLKSRQGHGFGPVGQLGFFDHFPDIGPMAMMMLMFDQDFKRATGKPLPDGPADFQFVTGQAQPGQLGFQMFQRQGRHPETRTGSCPRSHRPGNQNRLYWSKLFLSGPYQAGFFFRVAFLAPAAVLPVPFLPPFFGPRFLFREYQGQELIHVVHLVKGHFFTDVRRYFPIDPFYSARG